MSKKIIREDEIVNKYNEGLSATRIAKEYDTHTNKIMRILKKYDVRIRSASESQKLALESGRAKHPTKGKTSSEDTRLRQSKAHQKRWGKMTEEERKESSKHLAESLRNMSDTEKQEIRSKAAVELRKASTEGSKAERYLCEYLNKVGYDVEPHKTDLITGKYEIDIFLPSEKMVIEVDGPQHFLPIFGEDSLKKHIQYDNAKNGLLLKKGYSIVRVKYLCKKFNIAVMDQLKKKVVPVIESLKFSEKAKIVEVEINV